MHSCLHSTGSPSCEPGLALQLVVLLRLPFSSLKLHDEAANAGNYEEYFGMATDVEAVVYMMLMNEMVHSLFPTAITVGEDVSGMPTLCRWGPQHCPCSWLVSAAAHAAVCTFWPRGVSLHSACHHAG